MKEPNAFLEQKINFGASTYYEMIEWHNIMEPPLTKDIIRECVKDCINQKQFDRKMKFGNLLCNTQAIERQIKLVTEVSSRVSGHSHGVEVVFTKLVSRKKMPKFSLKCQFKD